MEKQRALRFLVHFFDVHCNDGTFYGGREHATTNSLFEPGYSLYELKGRKNWPHLTNRACLNRCGKVWDTVNSFLSGVFTTVVVIVA